jgi:hypothetical protein
MVPLYMCMGVVLSKCSPMYMVVELYYMLLISLQESIGYPRPSMRASSQVWSMDPKAFLKSM